MSGLSIDELEGDCPCGGGESGCPGAFGWVWKSSDLGHSSHRGKMWAEVCPSWKTDEKTWDTEAGEFVQADPPPPPGVENFDRFRTFNWDNMEQSTFEKSMNSKHERGTGQDANTGIGSGPSE